MLCLTPQSEREKCDSVNVFMKLPVTLSTNILVRKYYAVD